MTIPKLIQNDVTILEAIGKGWDPDKFVVDPESPYALAGQLIADADSYLAALEGNDTHPQVKTI
jgi:hypothetical protein